LDRDEVKVPRGKVFVLEERCKGCGFCVEYCPKDVLVLSDRFNRKGYHPPEVASEDDCVNCHLCEMICPDFAIFSLEITDSLEMTDDKKEEAGSKEGEQPSYSGVSSP
jgi:2-oxoglutarate ferredoxin oxidoreductase subunit delta